MYGQKMTLSLFTIIVIDIIFVYFICTYVLPIFYHFSFLFMQFFKSSLKIVRLHSLLHSRSAHQPETGRPNTNFILSQVNTAFFPRNHELIDTRSYVAISGIGL